ncbi:hypothetical protein [Melissospora conviva]|uniref:hypothetical protein n=1 Tax=Melissospora conviva TaxID=3388432 RepID=UPI003C1ACF8C
MIVETLRTADVSPYLADYTRREHNRLPDSHRRRIDTLIPGMAGTAGDGLDNTRADLRADWLIRTAVPMWLDAAGAVEQATAMRALRAVTDPASAGAAMMSLVAAVAAAGARAEVAAAVVPSAVRAAVVEAAEDAVTAVGGGIDSVNAHTAVAYAAWCVAVEAAQDSSPDMAGRDARAALAPLVGRHLDGVVDLIGRMTRPATGRRPDEVPVV